MSQTGPDVDRDTLERIELALPDWAGGVEVLERNLMFDGLLVAHWLAFSQGRVLLVSVVDGHADGAVLRAMDGLSFAHNQPEMLAASLGPLAGGETKIQVVLVALEGYSRIQLERLGTLPGAELELLRRRELCTQRGTHTRMEPVASSEGAKAAPPVSLPKWSLDGEFRTFLARIAPDRLQLALATIERIRRMEPQLFWCMEQSGLACQFNGISLARLHWSGGHLRMFFHEDRPEMAIRDQAGLELALESLLDVYLDVLSGGQSGGRRGTEPPPVQERAPLQRDEPGLTTGLDLNRVPPGFHEPKAPSTPEPLASELDEDELGELEDVEIQPLPPGPLLTRDEIEAFLD